MSTQGILLNQLNNNQDNSTQTLLTKIINQNPKVKKFSTRDDDSYILTFDSEVEILKIEIYNSNNNYGHFSFTTSEGSEDVNYKSSLNIINSNYILGFIFNSTSNETAVYLSDITQGFLSSSINTSCIHQKLTDISGYTESLNRTDILPPSALQNIKKLSFNMQAEVIYLKI